MIIVFVLLTRVRDGSPMSWFLVPVPAWWHSLLSNRVHVMVFNYDVSLLRGKMLCVCSKRIWGTKLHNKQTCSGKLCHLTFAMTGALAWQVKKIIKSNFSLVEGDRMGMPVFSLLCGV